MGRNHRHGLNCVFVTLVSHRNSTICLARKQQFQEPCVATLCQERRFDGILFIRRQTYHSETPFLDVDGSSHACRPCDYEAP